MFLTKSFDAFLVCSLTLILLPSNIHRYFKEDTCTFLSDLFCNAPNQPHHTRAFASSPLTETQRERDIMDDYSDSETNSLYAHLRDGSNGSDTEEGWEVGTPVVAAGMTTPNAIQITVR